MESLNEERRRKIADLEAQLRNHPNYGNPNCMMFGRCASLQEEIGSLKERLRDSPQQVQNEEQQRETLLRRVISFPRRVLNYLVDRFDYYVLDRISPPFY